MIDHTLKRLRLSATALVLITASCQQGENATEMLDRAYRAHGAGALARASMSFGFRGEQYVATRDRGIFVYERLYEDSAGTVRDFINNDGSYREVNGRNVSINARTAASILGKINSVVYFASLPFPLRDPAVRSRYLGTTSLDGIAYSKIEVTFVQEGGGPDYQDRFVYWINRRTGHIEFLAYHYLTNETGSRFRRLVNPREVGGFRIVDHVNYRAVPDTIGRNVDRFDELYENGALEVVSEVKHENVRVVSLD